MDARLREREGVGSISPHISLLNVGEEVKCFTDLSLVCYKKHKDLKDILIRAKVSVQR